MRKESIKDLAYNIKTGSGNVRILIINPNSDDQMAAQIQSSARQYAFPETTVDCVSTPGAPLFIENYEDALYCGLGILQIMREKETEYDAFIVACHDDVNLEAVREQTDKLVLGIGEVSVKVATMLGHRFSVIQVTSHSVPMKEDLMLKYGVQQQCASVRPVDECSKTDKQEKIAQAAQLAIEQDGAEVIVLGCAGLTGLETELAERLGVPVVDGVACALKMAEGLIKCGLTISKKRKYSLLKN